MKRSSNQYIRKTLISLNRVFQNEVFAERYAASGLLWQTADPRGKLVVSLGFLVYAATTQHTAVLLLLTAIAAFYLYLSGFDLKVYFKRVWLTVPPLLLIVSLPAATSWLIPGKALLPLVGSLTITAEGLSSIFRMALRVGTSLSFAYLLIMTTRWHHLTKALACLKVPHLMIGLLNLTYRYLFVLSKIAAEMMEARFLRTVGTVSSRSGREYIANRMAFLFIKSSFISDDIYSAMRSRGYTGSPVTLKTFRMGVSDKLWIFTNIVMISLILIGERVLL